MAIAFDSDSGFQSTTAASLTYAFTNVAGDGVVVGVTGATTDIITGATYAGNAMTLVDKIQQPSGRFGYLFYLTASPTGTNDVVVSASGSTFIGSQALSYSGTDQTQMKDSSNTGTTSAGASLTIAVVTNVDNCWLTGWFTFDGNNTLTAGANTTKRGANVDRAMFDTNAAQTPAGSYSLTVVPSPGESANFMGVVMGIAPAAGAAAGANVNRGLELIGVGQ